LTLGKYLTQGVYIGTKRGATSDSSGVEVEIELSPHLKIINESTGNDNKTGIQFKWDY
jgi:translocation and assembly module TamB